MQRNIAKSHLEPIAKYMMSQTPPIWWHPELAQPLQWGQMRICKHPINFLYQLRKKIIRQAWTELSMPKSIIEQIKAVGKKEGRPTGLVFRDREKTLLQMRMKSHLTLTWKWKLQFTLVKCLESNMKPQMSLQLLFVSARARRDIQSPVAFLTTRVKGLDEDDWGKFKRVLKYLFWHSAHMGHL